VKTTAEVEAMWHKVMGHGKTFTFLLTLLAVAAAMVGWLAAADPASAWIIWTPPRHPGGPP